MKSLRPRVGGWNHEQGSKGNGSCIEATLQGACIEEDALALDRRGRRVAGPTRDRGRRSRGGVWDLLRAVACSPRRARWGEGWRRSQPIQIRDGDEGGGAKAAPLLLREEPGSPGD